LRIIKSMRTGLLSRTFLYRRQHFFSVTMLWGFRLDTGRNVMEPHLWEMIGKTLAAGQPFDQAMPKGRAEFLVSGSFYAPGGHGVSGGGVGVTVGGVEKSLSVSGDRYWRPLGMSQPEPFTQMPIDYRHAFGGEQCASNPLGKGDTPVPGNAGDLHPLPNVEYAGSAVSSPDSKPKPAAYDHIGVMWEQRFRYSGTYDERYLTEAFLGLPDDIDWRYFNDGAQDQWFDDFLTGNEPFDIRNMHPEHAQITGQLPGIRGRCFVEQAVVGDDEDSSTRIREIPLKTDTVWLFPGEMTGLVMARGTLEVAEDDGSDILNLLLAAENQTDSPRPAEHYTAELKKRADPEQGYRYLLQTGPLLPEGCATEFEELGADSAGEESAVGANMEQFAKAQQDKLNQDVDVNSKEVVAELEKRGLLNPVSGKFDVSQVAVTPGAESADEAHIKALIAKALPEFGADPAKANPAKVLAGMDPARFAELEDYLASITNRELTVAKQKLEASRQEIAQEPNSAHTAEARDGLDQQINHLDALIEGRPVASRQPLPRPERELQEQIRAQSQQVSEQKQQLEAAFGSGQGSNEQAMVQLDDIEKAWGDAQRQINSAIEQLKEQHRITAQYLDPASSPHPGQEPQILEALLSAHRKGEPTAGGDYAFVDFRGQNLRGIDLSGARLEYANLAGCDLTQANLAGAVLTHARLDNARFSHTGLHQANFGRCQMQGAVFEHCDMTGVVLSFAELRAVRFEDCDLRTGMMPIQEAQFTECLLNRVRLDEHNFLDCVFRDCILNDCTLNKVVMIQPELTGSRFHRCELNEVSLLMAKADGVAFQQCQMRNSRLMGGCQLNRADFSGSLLDEATLREASLAHAVFTGARMNQSDFSGVEASDACFDRIVGRKSLWYKAELHSADFRYADLMEASLHKARLQEADFSHGSLYQANLLHVTLSNTRFNGCLMTGTLLQDWRPPAP